MLTSSLSCSALAVSLDRVNVSTNKPFKDSMHKEQECETGLGLGITGITGFVVESDLEHLRLIWWNRNRNHFKKFQEIFQSQIRM